MASSSNPINIGPSNSMMTDEPAQSAQINRQSTHSTPPQGSPSLSGLFLCCLSRRSRGGQERRALPPHSAAAGLTKSSVTSTSAPVQIENELVSPPDGAVGKLANILVDYNVQGAASEHGFKEINLFNRYGNDIEDFHIDNIIKQADNGTAVSTPTIIFYDQTTNNKDKLKSLAERPNITLISYEEIASYFERQDSASAKMITSLIRHNKNLVQCKYVGRAIDYQQLLDPIIICHLCSEKGILDNNSLLLKYMHMTKIYDKTWVEDAIKQTKGKFPIKADPNVLLITPVSKEAFKFLFYRPDLKNSIEKDKKHLNKADNNLEYGKLLVQDSARRYTTDNIPSFKDARFLKKIKEGENGFQYLKEQEGEIARWNHETIQRNFGSWNKSIVYDSLEKILDAMITRAGYMGKVEPFKMLQHIKQLSEHKSFTEEKLMEEFGARIKKRGLIFEDFPTKQLIFESTDNNALKVLQRIEELNAKFLDLDYAEGSLNPDKTKYTTLPRRKSPYKEVVTTDALREMKIAQATYNGKVIQN